MFVSETFYVELSYGQKVYGCSMNSGNDYMDGLNSYSHPSAMGYNMSDYFVDSSECTNECHECNGDVPLLDPTTGQVVTTDNFQFVCLVYGQKLYFASSDNMKLYVENSYNVPVRVLSLYFF